MNIRGSEQKPKSPEPLADLIGNFKPENFILKNISIILKGFHISCYLPIVVTPPFAVWEGYGYELIESQTKEFNEQHINRLEEKRSGTTVP